MPDMDIKMRIGLCLFLAVANFSAPDAHAEKGTATEQAIKAAVALKITKFVQWPDDAGNDVPIRFCVAGSQTMLKALARLESHSVKGRALAVTEVHDAAESALRCDALYVSDSGVDNPGEWLATVASLPILTFAESSKYETGGIITLHVRNKKVRFDIDAGASARSGITIGAQLLQLAAMSNGRKR